MILARIGLFSLQETLLMAVSRRICGWFVKHEIRLLHNSRSWPKGHHVKSEDDRSAISLSKNREVPLFVENLLPTWAFSAEAGLKVVIGLGL